jgi:hypothetical protein
MQCNGTFKVKAFQSANEIKKDFIFTDCLNVNAFDCVFNGFLLVFTESDQFVFFAHIYFFFGSFGIFAFALGIDTRMFVFCGFVTALETIIGDPNFKLADVWLFMCGFLFLLALRLQIYMQYEQYSLVGLPLLTLLDLQEFLLVLVLRTNRAFPFQS